ncbi:MAG: hypothetical protein FJZ01_04875 [Candidatus Sericytochromatia bacterium]|nr:hypothetical protein [Candidatus Tanganyikabacteria bacterium]
MNPARKALSIFLTAIVASLAGCSDLQPSEAVKYDEAAAWQTLGLKGARADFEKKLGDLAKVKLETPPEVGTDYHPKFPPDLPFKPEEWSTGKATSFVNDPRAHRGGTLRMPMRDWPPTLRTEGPNSRLKSTRDIHELVYETLLEYDVARGAYLPRLADYWWIGPDRKTFRFHIDKRARWADGRAVTADDVKATLEHLMREDRKDPQVAERNREMIKEVKVLDRLTVEITGHLPQWETMVTIGLGTPIYPAAYIRMDGETYLSEWNWKLPPGSGPYALATDGLQPGRSIAIKRRYDWWAEKDPANAGKFNFDAIVYNVIRDEELEYQKFFAGELDVYRVNRAQRWVDEIDKKVAIQKGWVQKRKLYNLEPQGYSGYCLNMRSAPFNDRDVRAAFAHLFNREKLFEKFFYFQYDYIDSYFPGQIYSRPNAQRIRFDPAEARRLLAKAGWSGRDGDGFLINGRGQRFPALSLDNADGPSFGRLHQVFKDDLWREAGIKLEILNVDYASLLKKVWEYKFSIVFFNWTASIFPQMEGQFASKLADKPQTNNLNGFKNAEADRLFDAYKYEFDQAKRLNMMQRVDEILFDQHPYALAWYAPYWRVLYWDKFGHPPEYSERFVGDFAAITRYWWLDPERARKTEQNRAVDKPNHPGKPLNQSEQVEDRYWLTHPEPRVEPGRDEALRALGVEPAH